MGNPEAKYDKASKLYSQISVSADQEDRSRPEDGNRCQLLEAKQLTLPCVDEHLDFCQYPSARINLQSHLT